MTSPPPPSVTTLSFAAKSPVVCSPVALKHALALGADVSSQNGTLVSSHWSSDPTDEQRCRVGMPVMPSVRPPVLCHWRDCPPQERTYSECSPSMSFYSGRPFNNCCPLMCPRCHPRQSCSRQAEKLVSRSLLPQTGRAGTTVPGRRQGTAGYTTTTRCGGFVVAPLFREVPQRLGDVQLLRCADAGGLCDGGVGGIVGSV